MNVSDVATQTFAGNPLTLLNTFLIIITILLSYNAYKFRTRASVRESLEQLDDVEFRKEKLRPILHELDFRLIRKHRTTVHLKYYTFGREPASASLSNKNLFWRTFYQLNNKDADGIPTEQLREAIAGKSRELDKVEKVWIEDTGIYLQFKTGNAVQVRRWTEDVLQNLITWHTTNNETFSETFGVDPLEIDE
jgi:hypothetical protein